MDFIASNFCGFKVRFVRKTVMEGVLIRPNTTLIPWFSKFSFALISDPSSSTFGSLRVLCWRRREGQEAE